MNGGVLVTASLGTWVRALRTFYQTSERGQTHGPAWAPASPQRERCRKSLRTAYLRGRCETSGLDDEIASLRFAPAVIRLNGGGGRRSADEAPRAHRAGSAAAFQAEHVNARNARVGLWSPLGQREAQGPLHGHAARTTYTRTKIINVAANARPVPSIAHAPGRGARAGRGAGTRTRAGVSSPPRFSHFLCAPGRSCLSRRSPRGARPPPRKEKLAI